MAARLVPASTLTDSERASASNCGLSRAANAATFASSPTLTDSPDSARSFLIASRSWVPAPRVSKRSLTIASDSSAPTGDQLPQIRKGLLAGDVPRLRLGLDQRLVEQRVQLVALLRVGVLGHQVVQGVDHGGDWPDDQPATYRSANGTACASSAARSGRSESRAVPGEDESGFNPVPVGCGPSDDSVDRTVGRLA